jgi:hypothetical protein
VRRHARHRLRSTHTPPLLLLPVLLPLLLPVLLPVLLPLLLPLLLQPPRLPARRVCARAHQLVVNISPIFWNTPLYGVCVRGVAAER